MNNLNHAHAMFPKEELEINRDLQVLTGGIYHFGDIDKTNRKRDFKIHARTAIDQCDRLFPHWDNLLKCNAVWEIREQLDQLVKNVSWPIIDRIDYLVEDEDNSPDVILRAMETSKQFLIDKALAQKAINDIKKIAFIRDSNGNVDWRMMEVLSSLNEVRIFDLQRYSDLPLKEHI